MKRAFRLRLPEILHETVEESDRSAEELTKLKDNEPQQYMDAVLEDKANHTERIAELYFRTCCEIWDGVLEKPRRREFYDAVYKYCLLPLFLERERSIVSPLSRIGVRIRQSRDQIDASVGRYGGLVAGIRTRWKSRLESLGYEAEVKAQPKDHELDGNIAKTSPSASKVKSTRAPSRPGPKLRPRMEEFIRLAGKLWNAELKKSGRGRVDYDALVRIAGVLDRKNLRDPADFLEGTARKALRDFNSQNAKSTIGPILTWTKLASSKSVRTHTKSGKKIPFRTDMRRRLSRCARLIRK